MAKRQKSLETLIKEGFAEVHKVIHSLTLDPTRVNIERNFMKVEFNGSCGYDFMIIGRDDKDDRPWITNMESFSATAEQIAVLKEPKNITGVSSNETSIIINTLKSNDIILKHYNLPEKWQPIDELAKNMQWAEIDLRGKFSKSTDFIRLNLDTGEIVPPGQYKKTEAKGSSIITLGRKLYPKIFETEDSKSFFALEEIDDNLAKLYGLFLNNSYAAFVSYHDVLNNF